ncbi:hypothetical protein H3S89_03880 [Bartonella sp. B10834G6]|uniref:hypothetical protein n=1 Tax=Bartonella apis TaxID=1686310 RepID=UPI0018DD883C|nr:hypothetical protein [Bartonella apis]MBH9981934.1 hypothetical protein [Bartonella apis]
MLKHSSDALQLSTYTRRSHFVYSVFEYLLVIVVTLAAIFLLSTIFVDEFSDLMGKSHSQPIVNSTLSNR